MKNKVKLLILLFFIILGVIIFSVTRETNPDLSSTDSNNIGEENQAETSESAQESMGEVNPEEKNSLLLKAGLPYENDSYAITYRFDDAQDEGVTIIVIDKTSKTTGSPTIKSTVYDYFKVRGIDSNNLNIEYEVL